MTPNSSLVSIIVRTKDRPRLLMKALRSVASQDYRPLEIVLVNDGGCEPDPEAIRKAAGDVEVRCIVHSDPKGRAQAANAGLEQARGTYIGFLDDDDELLPDHVSTLVGALELSDFRVAYSDCRRVYSFYDPDKRRYKDDPAVIIKSREPDAFLLLHENYIPFICLLFERTVLSRVGYLDPQFELYEDWDFIIRLSKEYPFVHVAKVTALYRYWNPQGQLAFIGGRKSENAYLAVVEKHFQHMTPEVLLRFYHEKKHVDTLYEEKDLELSNRIRQSRKRMLGLSRIMKQRLAHLQEHMQKLDTRTTRLQAELDGLYRTEDEYRHLLLAARTELDAVRTQLDAMRATLGWRMVQGTQGLLNRVFPPGSKRAWPYEKTKAVVRMLLSGGVPLLKQRLGRKMSGSFGPLKGAKRYAFSVPELFAPFHETLDIVVSVVIPTRNAGNEFEYVLDKVQAQKGIRRVEVVVIDSESTDDTARIAADSGALVIQQPKAAFSHSVTRNLGAERCTGEYVVFMTQDAVPVGDYALYQMTLTLMRNPDAAAVTLREVPRVDADLFACWQIWNHGRSLDLLSDTFFSADPHRLSAMKPFEKRKLAQLNNICCCVRKNDFDAFRFQQVEYAEDLDLGLRLLQAGRSLGYLHSVGVIHSHNRPASYFLKRSFVDCFSLSRILGYDSIPWRDKGFESFQEVYLDGIRLLSFIGGLAREAADSADTNTETLADFLMRAARHPHTGMKSLQELGDEALESLITTLDGVLFPTGKPPLKRSRDFFLRDPFLTPLESFLSFAGTRPSWNGRIDELQTSLIKLASVFVGAQMGHAAFYFSQVSGSPGNHEEQAVRRAYDVLKGDI